MATHVQYTVVDDMDGGTDGIGTYRFALEGIEYEIDLSTVNIGKLRGALQPFIAAGRRQPKDKSATRRSTGATSERLLRQQMRTWWAAREQELNLAPYTTHGRIPRSVREAYHAHH